MDSTYKEVERKVQRIRRRLLSLGIGGLILLALFLAVITDSELPLADWLVLVIGNASYVAVLYGVGFVSERQAFVVIGVRIVVLLVFGILNFIVIEEILGQDAALINTLAEIVGTAAPLLIAAQGELITERAGIVNLSLDGSILLAAVAAFAVAIETGSTEAGILVAMLVGMVIALIIITANVLLRVDQIAVGFVLTLLAADLSSFVGRDYSGLPGGEIEIPPLAIPLLKDIPIMGKIFFQHNLMVYFTFILVAFIWFWIYRTGPGLSLRALGERPTAAFVRGTRVQLLRYVYVAIGGALVGLAGAGFSLSVTLGWRVGLTSGQGWIALAIVIFGTWKPMRILAGAYLIVGLRSLALFLQRQDQLDLAVSVINMTPWLLMLLTLMFVASGFATNLLIFLPERWRPAAASFLRSDPPAALGTAFEKE